LSYKFLASNFTLPLTSYMKIIQTLVLLLFVPFGLCAQLSWKNADSLYQPLPPSVHVYFSDDSLDGKPNIAYYVEADLKDKRLNFTTAVGNGKRYTPSKYYSQEQQPLIVVNTTFFEFVNNSNLNVVMKDGKMVAYNQQTTAGRGKDTFTYYHVTPSAIGISKKRKADVAWLYTDSSYRWPIAFEKSPIVVHDSLRKESKYTYAASLHHFPARKKRLGIVEKWKMQTAVGGGPVLVHDGRVRITNNEERKFSGKAINDKHPRTTMGYTKNGKLIILVFQGRFPNLAEGATPIQQAQVLKSLGCWEALNLDGGGSSCLLINGKETIKPSDKEGQRAVPAVFLIKQQK
jgi:hypothetical protein